MSDIENRKIQDILRAVADAKYEYGIDTDAIIARLCDALGINFYGYGPAALRVMREIADRIDKQSVVEVQVPPRAETKPTAIALDALEDVQDALTPTIIDVHDCFVTINVYGDDDDQD